MKPYRKNITVSRWSRLRAWRSQTDQGLEYDLHFHPEHELVLVLEGHGEVWIGNEVMSFGPGDLVAIDADVPHSFTTLPDGLPHLAQVIHFSEEALGGLDARLCSPARAHKAGGIVFDAAVTAPTRAAFQQAISCWEVAEAPLEGLKERSALYAILVHLAGCRDRERAYAPESRSRSGGELARMTELLNFVNQNHQRAITLSDAASIAKMRSESLCRFFKRHFGMTFTQYLNEVRLGHAARSLTTTEEPVLEIALQAGYANLSYFNRRFKRRFSMTPLGYRKKHRAMA